MQQPSIQKVHFPAPMGGVNSVDSASELPDKDCVYAYNLIRAQLGLRSRSGYQEWVPVGSLTGATNNEVRTVLPYSGSAANQVNDKLFATTATGIWDVTQKGYALWQANTAYVVGNFVTNGPNVYICTIGGTSAGSGGPTGTGNGIVDNGVTWNFVSKAFSQVLAFGSTVEPAGYGVSALTSTFGGRYMLLADEINGPFIYTEATNTWAAIPAGVTALWQTNMVVAVGTAVQNGGNTYVCTTGGTTNGSGTGPSGVGAGIMDGSTVVWTGTAGAPAAGTAIGPSVADQNNGLYVGVGANLPATFAAVAVWKNRVFYVEKGSTRGWYLGLNSVYGTATSFDFGFKMLKGGPLVNLYKWSFDGGSGPDERLVAISTAGDVVIYAGPDIASTSFGLVGTWNLGGVPYGRRIAVEYGGDILVASMLGLIPLSKLIIGNPAVDRTVYDTYKVSNLFGQLAVTFQTRLGWAIIHHPADNAILVNVPQPQGWSYLQFAMATSARTWGVYRDLPLISGATWNGVLYIGTADGRVCACTGPLDNVTLTNPAANIRPVKWSLLTAFKGADAPGRKIVQQARVYVLSAVPSPILQAVAKLDFDTSEPVDTSGSGAGGAGTWDNGKWDQALWGGDQTTGAQVIGLFGEATCAVGLAVRGQAISYTTFVGADVYYEEGGIN